MNLKTYLFFLSSAFCVTASAQFTEQFNSRPGIPGSQVKNFLQAACWNFSSFTSSNKSEELIEGDGSLMSIVPANSGIPAGIYSPLLDIHTSVSIAFKYRFLSRRAFTSSPIKIYLATAANQQQLLLDSLPVDQQLNTTLNYHRDFENIVPGTYKLFIEYSQPTADARLVLDDLAIEAAMHYPGGCNTVPVANEDMVTLNESGISTTSITGNDSDSDNDAFRPFIETGSPDGIVELNADNTFSFKPNNGFKGNSTTFTYRICETGTNGLCSESTKVIVNVPATAARTELLHFAGEYLQAGNIALHWETTPSHAVIKYDLERSLDGKSWQHAGTVNAGAATTYVFNDHVNKNIANRNDIFYRLTEIKKNAVITSKLLIVRVYNSPGVRMVSVTPDPDKNDINVTLQLNQPSITSMKVVSSSGDEVFRKTVKTAGEINNILLDGTSKLEPGLYTLDVIINSRERMLVQLLKD